MKFKKLDFRVNLGIDKDFDKAIKEACLVSRMTKTGYIRHTLLTDLVKHGFLKTKAKVDAR